jgi:anion-transporting  ArsA/GET3 family ATPase
VLGGSRIFQLLTAAAPGVSELVTMGKIWDLAQFQRRSGGSVFDLAIVDAPSTGHGLALLRAPGTYAHIARVGPIARQANQIDAFVRNPASTGLAVVALPEEMPVNETIELERRVRDDMGLHVDWILANAVLPERFSKAEVRSLLSAEEAARGSARAAVVASLSEHRRAAGQREQLERLRRGTSAPVTTLPFLFEPELGRAELEELSLLLEEAL